MGSVAMGDRGVIDPCGTASFDKPVRLMFVLFLSRERPAGASFSELSNDLLKPRFVLIPSFRPWRGV